MSEQIEKVLSYIDTHLSEELNITQLAKVASYSPYHLGRIFKVYTGETLINYVTKRRLEKSKILMHSRNKNFLNIALDSGFKTQTGFLKAFKKYFQMTPSQYKKQYVKNFKDFNMATPEIVTRESIEITYTRELGNYINSAEPAWKRLSSEILSFKDKNRELIKNSGVDLEIQNAELLGLCHDDPQNTSEEKIRYDACVAYSQEGIALLKEHNFATKSIAGGKYLKTTYTGYKNSYTAWFGLYTWIVENNIECRDEPPFEKYITTVFEGTPEDECISEIYIPIK